MFVLDIPDVPMERAPLVLAQTDVKQIAHKPLSTVGVYQIAGNSVDAERIDIRRNSQSSLRPTRAISKVHIGGDTSKSISKTNPAKQRQYPNMTNVLDKLDILNSPVKDHQNHFHIYLAPPPNPIKVANLLAEEPLNASQDLLTDVGTRDAKLRYDFVTSRCLHVSHSWVADNVNVFVPQLYAEAIFLDRGIKIQSSSAGKLVQAPAHGSFNLEQDTDGSSYWQFKPEQKYIGPDKAAFEVIVNGKKVLVRYQISITLTDPQNLPCPVKPETYRQEKEWLKQHPDYRLSCNSDQLTIGLTDLGTWLSSATIDGLLSDLARVSYSFQTLPNGLVGQTVGDAVTLDTNAAGHGWFVDTTPDDNDEFLATSDPNVWIARAGSAADGKMDMLSVLLHEYGHVLGLAHSGDNDDAMSAVLQPGVRKLWSETDLAKLNEIRYLVYQDSPLPDTAPFGGSTDGLPPAGSTRASTPVARRPRRDANLNNDLLSDAKIDALNAINPTLTNGDLFSPLGWDTTGVVNIANGRATLAETARSQSRLTQGFVLSSLDRYLSFTVDGLAMTDSTVGPDDAFEVALLNANTRAALTSTVALTRSDALLNIQANGTEKRSDKLRRIDNTSLWDL